jgi:hypothetical protein
MPARPVFQGKPLAFLKSTVADYSEAVKQNQKHEEGLSIVRRFHKRFDIGKPLSDEPSDEFLASVDDDAPDTTYPRPDKESLTEPEYEQELKKWQEWKKVSLTRRDVSKTLFVSLSQAIPTFAHVSKSCGG